MIKGIKSVIGGNKKPGFVRERREGRNSNRLGLIRREELLLSSKQAAKASENVTGPDMGGCGYSILGYTVPVRLLVVLHACSVRRGARIMMVELVSQRLPHIRHLVVVVESPRAISPGERTHDDWEGFERVCTS
jgi:hypothetical protein